MNENRSPIPSRLYNAAKGGHVAGAADIIDDDKGKTQDVINEEVDEALDDTYRKSETYNKTELNNMITTPSQEYVTVVATDQTTSATDVLPATGSANTIYRVGNWDGTQYDESLYTEYAWNGSAYVRVGVKSQVGEVYDISLNHAGTTYADLTAALGTNGANIPQSLRKGGMSVKYVCSSDNNYIQARLVSNSFTTDVTQWQTVDTEPTANSKNLIESGGVAEAIQVLKKVELSDTPASEEVIKIKNESETETIVSISENGVDAKNLKSNGAYVVTHDDLNVDAASSTSEEEQEQVWCNNSETEDYAKIGSYGIKAKSFQTLGGSPLGKSLFDIVVDANGGGDYTTIEAALNNAGDTQTRHVNILIKCGTYTPAPLVSNNNPYKTNYRNISLIGENRNKCIIKNTIGFYDYTIGTDCAPLRLGGNITIENLTVICTSEDFDEYSGTPGYVGRDDYRKAAYCIHRDWYDRQGDAFVIKNCTLINDHMACIGFGLKENTKLVVENCLMQSEQAAEHSQENNYAPLWGHISSGEKGLGQDLIVIGCTIVNKTGPYGFKFRWDVKAADATPQDTHASLTFQGNILKSTDSENIINIPAGGYGFWEITDVSFNNNVSQLNK